MRSLIRRTPKSRECDPAPSRWAWRAERLMLTPTFRIFLRAGLPLIAIVGAASWWISDQGRRDAIMESVAEARATFETRPEFMVLLMAIDGAQDALAHDIREAVPMEFPLSSFDLDLGKIRESVVKLGPVKSATVRIKPGGVLQVNVEPRHPVAIWRGRKGLVLVDADGVLVNTLESRMDRPDLPLFAGVGAAAHVEEALQLHQAALPLGERLRGVVRIGQRRWDIVLDRDQRILLPEEGAVEALERVIALDSAQDILSRDIKRVDMRLSDRPTIKMSDYASDTWWDIQTVSRQ